MKYNSISFIIPIYNEEKTIGVVLEKLSNLNIGLDKEILVVDDGSSDDSVKIVKEIQKDILGLKLIVHKKNSGKGAALRTGFENASGDIVTIQDADLEYNIEDFVNLIKPIIMGKAKVVYGSRFLKKNKKGYGLFYFGNRFLSLITSILYFTRVTDMETCYKVFDGSVAKWLKIERNGFDVEPEITSKILKAGYEIIELPIDYSPRSILEGKKIKVHDGFVALWALIKYRFN
jgi:glycosyltransferase involved in cell wall biosynthesis